jgi:ERCC4-type nuclease
VEAVVKAKAEELRVVSGIGKRIAEQLRWCVEQPRREYRLA